MAPLTFETTLNGADAFVILHGELDLSGAQSLEGEVERLADTPGLARLVLDLRDLEFLDSSGLRLVALAERRLSPGSASLVLVRGPEVVQRVFEITGMAGRLTFVDTPAALDADPSRP